MDLIENLLHSLLEVIFVLLNPLILIPAVILLIVFIKKHKEYKNSTYYQITKLSYPSVKRDTGRYGEYLTYKHLKHLEANGAKFLFNLYIPKGNGETTEIDLLMIHAKGIFVFESKNYSGWIFGTESNRNWYQTLPSGRGRSHKEHFYNPIMQNRTHIKHLKALLGEQIPMFSIIVFSERCTLKRVQVNSCDASIIKRSNVADTVSAICNRTQTDVLDENTITDIYNQLFSFTQVDETVKSKHIDTVQNNIISPPVCRSQPVSQISGESSPPEPIPSDDDVLPTLQTEKPVSPENQVLKCPKCGGALVLRTATRGTNAGNQFYGCSNYPKCRYIKNISN